MEITSSIVEEKALDREKTIEIWYSFAIGQPSLEHELPQEEWISAIRPI